MAEIVQVKNATTQAQASAAGCTLA
jgi:hypothetical protein